MKATSYNPPASLKRLRQIALVVGALFIAIMLVGYLLNPVQFFHSYVFAFCFWTGISVGSLALLMLQHLSGGGWGLVIRRILEAATQTLPLMLLMFVPLVLGAHSIYSWTHPEELAEHPSVASKASYLNLPFFTIRAVVYFAIWILLAYLLTRWSTLQDQTADREYAKKMRVLSGPGMVLIVFTVTFAAIDWFMSLEPEWFSTIYGLIFVASWALSALAFSIAVVGALSKDEPVSHFVGQYHFHDLGKLLLALVMLWTYFSFSQFLIIWSGNLPEEIHYYLPRIQGGWGAMALLVVILHFAFPFLFLLSRSFKRDSRKLVLIAVLILVMRLVDLFWTITPSFTHEHFHVSWMDLVAPIGIGGIWLSAFSWALSKRPMIPINDPQFESVLEQVHAHSGH
jgi:hypothetical protein